MSKEYGENIAVNNSVELSPHLDLWMRGAQYGVVQAIKNGIATVEMDHPKIKKLVKIKVEDLKKR